MLASFAAGTLVVIGVLLVFLGLFAAGNLAVVIVGLGSIAAGGVLALLDRRRPAAP
jgi:hypothetical protein